MNSTDLIFAFIERYIKDHNYPPSIREVCEGTGLSSTSTVQSHLKTLRKQGRIEWVPSHPRTLTIVKDPDA